MHVFIMFFLRLLTGFCFLFASNGLFGFESIPNESNGLSFLTGGTAVTDQADPSQGGSLASLLKSIQNQPWTVVVPSGIFEVKSNLDVPPNVHLVIRNGGQFSVESGKTLRVLGSLDAGPWPIFVGNGSAVLGKKVSTVLPHWWRQEDDWSVSIQKAIDWSTSRHVYLPGGDYAVEKPIYFNSSGVTITGSGTDHTTIYGTLGGLAFFRGSNDKSTAPRRLYQIRISDLTIRGASMDQRSDIGLDLTNVSDASIERVFLKGLNTGALIEGIAYYNNLVHVVAEYVKTGFLLKGGANENSLIRCRTNIGSIGFEIAASQNSDISNNSLISCAAESLTEGGCGLLLKGYRVIGPGKKVLNTYVVGLRVDVKESKITGIKIADLDCINTLVLGTFLSGCAKDLEDAGIGTVCIPPR